MDIKLRKSKNEFDNKVKLFIEVIWLMSLYVITQFIGLMTCIYVLKMNVLLMFMVMMMFNYIFYKLIIN